MKVLYYSKYSEKGPSSRYRAFQFQEAFRGAGVDFQIQNLFDDHYFEILRMPGGISRGAHKIKYVLSRFRNRMNWSRDGSDLIVIEGQLFPYLPFRIERKYLPSRYLVEFDDAIYMTHPNKLPKVIANARAVIAGNTTLVEYAQHHNQNVHHVPTVIDTTVFSPKPKPASNTIRIGWTGLAYNHRYLRALTPVFWRLSAKFPVEFVIVSNTPPESFSFPFRFEKWDALREAEQINQFDIGVMPLEIDEWCKGKCGFKLIQYMSLAIPAVATPVGVNAEILSPGQNGFSAVGLEQWEDALTKLVEDCSLRSRIGKAGRQTIIDHYSTQVWFPRLLEIYSRYWQ